MGRHLNAPRDGLAVRRIVRAILGEAKPRSAFSRLGQSARLDLRFVTHEPPATVASWKAALEGGAPDAVGRINAAAQDGDVRAQTALGHLLLSGHGAAQDAAAACKWFERAARRGHAEAANMAGRCHEMGWGVPARPDLAAGWYRQAAEAGDAWAQFNLAMLLFDGDGCRVDRHAALVWFLRAGRRGHAKAMNMLGRYAEEGWRGRMRPAAAPHWYRRAAQAGDFRGQFNHARLLFSAGRREEALSWLARSVEAGIPVFCRNVGADLAGSRDPALRRVGLRALERACDSGARHDAETLRRARLSGLPQQGETLSP